MTCTNSNGTIEVSANAIYLLCVYRVPLGGFLVCVNHAFFAREGHIRDLPMVVVLYQNFNIFAPLQIKNIDGSPTFRHSNVNIVVVVDNK